MRTQNREHYCPSCGTIIHGNEKYCPECGRVQRNSSHRGKYLNSSKKHGKEGAIILILGILVLVLGISTLVFFFKAQEPADISLQETADVSDPIITETTVGTTEEPTEQSQATTEEATESPTEFTEYIPETTPTQVATEATNPEEMTGTVLRSAGELNVRSGAGTNYSVIGRLYGGDSITVYEQENVNGIPWYSIGWGWVSGEYIVFGTDNSMPPDVNVLATSDKQLEYVGEWVNEDSTYVMTISVSGKSASIHVIYYFSSTGRISWQMTGEFDEHNAIRYWNGIRTDNNNGVETVKYTNGEGAINLYQSQLEWHEFMEQPCGVFKTFTRAGAHTPNPPYLNNDNTSQNQPEQNNGIPQQNGGSDNTTGSTGKYYHFDSGDFEKAIIREIKVEVGYRAGDELSYVNSSASLRNSVDNIYWCTGSGRYCGQSFFVTADVENVNGRLVVNEIDVKFV